MQKESDTQVHHSFNAAKGKLATEFKLEISNVTIDFLLQSFFTLDHAISILETGAMTKGRQNNCNTGTIVSKSKRAGPAKML